MIAAGSKTGETTCSEGSTLTPERSPGPSIATAIAAVTIAPGAAHGREMRVSAAQTTITGRASHGMSTTARTGPTQMGSRMPASIALASAAGIAAIARPSARQRPLSTMSTPHTRNAPTAAGNPPLGAPVESSSAAPGVDHAMASGIRVRRLSRIATTPAPTLTASRPDAASARSAPAARSPASTTGNAPEKPTSAVTQPASTGATRSDRLLTSRWGRASSRARGCRPARRRSAARRRRTAPRRPGPARPPRRPGRRAAGRRRTR